MHLTTELLEPIFWAANAITVEPQENDVMKNADWHHKNAQSQTFTTNNLQMWKAFKSMAGTENKFSFII